MQGENIYERSLHTSARGWARRWEQTQIEGNKSVLKKERKTSSPAGGDGSNALARKGKEA